MTSHMPGAGTTKSTRPKTTHPPTIDRRLIDALNVGLAPMLCRLIGVGALLTGTIMVVYAEPGLAASNTGATSAVVHLSNVKFMAILWAVVGLVFLLSAAHLHQEPTWRIVRLFCFGITFAAMVRIFEMLRLETFSLSASIAASIELFVPPLLIALRHPGESPRALRTMRL